MRVRLLRKQKLYHSRLHLISTYLHVDTPAEEAATYINMTLVIAKYKNHISATVYTQISDVELECT